MRWPQFAGPSYTSQSPIASAEECINWYVEKIGEASKVQYALYPTHGGAAFATVAKSGDRNAALDENGRVWKIIGDGWYEFYEDGSSILRATLAIDQYPATLSSGGDACNELFATSGDKGYILNRTTNAVTTVLNSGASMGGFIGGVFVSFDRSNSTFRISDTNDGLTWDPTQIVARSTAADRWLNMTIVSGRMFLFGEKTSDAYYYSGAFPMPLEPVSTTVIEYGIAAPFAAGVLGDSVVWLGRNAAGVGTVLQATGLTPREIQTHAVAYQVSRYTTTEDCTVWSFQDQGHPFLMFDFPAAAVTWVFDGATGLWHKRMSWDGDAGVYTAWRARGHVQAWGQHLVGDRDGSTVYSLDIANYTDVGGGIIRRLRRPPALFKEHKRLTLTEIELFLESGVGLTSGQGSDPEVMMRLSKNGGKTYGNTRTRKAGKIGEYGTRVVWNRCGGGRDFVPEFVVTDPIPWRVLDAYVTVSVNDRAT